jgi:exodeoxyribonuclease V alpha subunit
MSTSAADLARSTRLRRVDAALGEWVARAFPDVAPEVTAAAALAARAIADGHSALALDQAQAWLDGIAGDGKPTALPDAGAWHDILRASPAVHAHDGSASPDTRPLVLDAQRRVYLRRYFEYERELARTLITRATGPHTESRETRRSCDSPFGPASPFAPASCLRSPSPESRFTDIDPEQQRAIEVALAHRFTLVTGGPGTGKTHGVVRILAALAQHAPHEPLRIALAAPTGKAAARLGESLRAQLAGPALPEAVARQIPRDAQTVHGLLGVSPWRATPKFHRALPLPFDVIVVDEVSMVDLPLMAKLVDAVPETARLILLGDPDQLSAVEAGNVLGALVQAARDGPLADCHVALTRSHRFGTDSALGALARAIALGDVDAALHACERDAAVAIADETRVARFFDDAVAAFRAVVDAHDPAEALRAARGFRVLTALRQGTSGCIAIDRAIAAGLQRRLGARVDDRWWQGRLILVTANRPELKLFNGDTGVAWPDADGVPKVWFDGSDGKPRALAPAALPPHEGAFALTVHKAQGSEFDRVALVTGPDSAVLTRELLYTGVTRARSGIAVYSTVETLRTGIGRRTLRMTGLADRLREADAAPNSIAESLPDGT